jgi:dihydromonapterin reductase/dihydrofolate reductase
LGPHTVKTLLASCVVFAASKAAQDNLTLSFAALPAPEVKVNSIASALVLFDEDGTRSTARKPCEKA